MWEFPRKKEETLGNLLSWISCKVILFSQPKTEYRSPMQLEHYYEPVHTAYGEIPHSGCKVWEAKPRSRGQEGQRTCLCCHSGYVWMTQRHPGACTHSKSVLFPADPTGVSWGQNSHLKDSIQFQVSAKLWDEIWKEKENPRRFMSQWAQIMNFCFDG